jgi:hypothetical protein
MMRFTGWKKYRSDYSGYFDLGWGEGIAVEMWLGAVRYWRRTGNAGLLSYVDEMTRNMDLFKRGPAADAPYFDRSDGAQFGDFLIADRPGQRIWTHSLGHIGSQLIQLYLTASDYPNRETQNDGRRPLLLLSSWPNTRGITVISRMGLTNKTMN